MTRIDQDRWNMASHVALTRRDPKNPQDVRVGLQGDMRQIFHESVQPTMAHTFVVEPRESAIKIFPELKAAYARLDAITAHASKLPDRDAGNRLGLLIATEEGWVCPHCDYKQDWAHAMTTDARNTIPDASDVIARFFASRKPRPETLDELIANYKRLASQNKQGADVMVTCIERRKAAILSQ